MPGPCSCVLGNRHPLAVYEYLSADGGRLGYIARYAKEGGAEGKEFFPWTHNGTKWVCKGFPEPRPLYGLDRLAQSPAPVMLVEGEGKVDALLSTTITYVPIAWPHGALSVGKTDFEPLRGRAVVLWPDRDDPGRKALAAAAEILLRMGCDVKVLTVDGNDGWDAKDAVLIDGWDWPRIVEWAKTCVKTLEAPAPVLPALQATATALPALPVTEVVQPIQIAADDAPPDDEVVTFGTVRTWEAMGLSRNNNGEGKPHMNGVNASKLLEYRVFPAHYDLFTGCYMTTIDWSGNTDRGRKRLWDPVRDTVYLRHWVQQQAGFEMLSRDAIKDGFEKYCQDHAINEAQEWIHGLKWDKEPRLATWLHRHLGVENSLYHKQVGESVIRSMAARILKPGCQVHSMLTLVSKEGWGKSSVARILGDPWYASIGTSWDKDRDMAQKLRGLMVAEIAENESGMKSSAEAMKRMVTTAIDRVVEKYQNLPTDIVRTNIFIVTANHGELLDDNTGYRRYLPVVLGREIDLKALASERDQLVAEAALQVRQGEQWHIVEGASDEAKKFRVEDPYDQPIAEYVFDLPGGSVITISDALKHLCIPLSQHNMGIKRRIGQSLRLSGCTSKVMKGNIGTFVGFTTPNHDLVAKWESR